MKKFHEFIQIQEAIYHSLKAGDKCIYRNRECTIRSVIGSSDFAGITYDDDGSEANVRINYLKKIEKPYRIKWYKKGKLQESKDEELENLSYLLEPLTKIDELRPNLTPKQYFDFLNDTVNKVFLQLKGSGRKVTTLIKKKNSYIERSFLVDLYEILSPEGCVGIYDGQTKARYLIDLLNCAKYPEKFPIYAQESIRKYTNEDPYGEEIWMNESVEQDPYGEENWENTQHLTFEEFLEKSSKEIMDKFYKDFMRHSDGDTSEEQYYYQSIKFWCSLLNKD